MTGRLRKSVWWIKAVLALLIGFAAGRDLERSGEGGDPPPAFRTSGSSRHGDWPHGFASGQGFAHEEVDMRLQEAAGAELEDREFAQLSLRAGAASWLARSRLSIPVDFFAQS